MGVLNARGFVIIIITSSFKKYELEEMSSCS
jgi:hypothetical protein